MQFVITYPIVHGATLLVNVAAVVAKHLLAGTTFDGLWSAQADPQEILAEYEGWDTVATTLLHVGRSSNLQ